jgi:hypothetical protein
MWYFKFYGHQISFLRFFRGKRTTTVALILCVATVVGMLTACGSAATGQVQHLTKTPMPTLVPTPTLTPTTQPTVVPTPRPVAPPTQPPAAPAILDLQPASMSLLGHRDCQKTTAYTCQARVLSRASNQSYLDWSSYTDVPGYIVFNPSSGSLPPGQSVVVTITVPLNACTPGLFYFRGPINTHTITWAC